MTCFPYRAKPLLESMMSCHGVVPRQYGFNRHLGLDIFFKRYKSIFRQLRGNVFENVVCKLSAHFCGHQCFDTYLFSSQFSVDSNFTKSMFEFGSPLQSKPQSNNGSPSTSEAPEPLVHATYPTVVSPGSSKDAPASHMGSLLCGVRHWEVPAFQDAVECMGLGPIFDAGSPWVRRLFWTTVVILGWVLAVYQIVQQIQVYFQWPVSTMVDIT